MKLFLSEGIECINTVPFQQYFSSEHPKQSSLYGVGGEHHFKEQGQFIPVIYLNARISGAVNEACQHRVHKLLFARDGGSCHMPTISEINVVITAHKSDSRHWEGGGIPCAA